MNKLGSLTLAVLIAFGASGSAGCKGSLGPAAGGSPKGAASPAACRALGSHVIRFGETLEEVGESTKTRGSSYAGLLELLLTFERASSDLEAQLAALRIDDPAMSDVVKRAGSSLEAANEFARQGSERVAKSAERLGPSVKESDAAYRELRAACDGKRALRDCAPVDDALGKMTGAPFAEHVKLAEALGSVTIATPSLARARDRAVAATRALASKVDAETKEMVAVAREWTAVEKRVQEAFVALSSRCEGVPFDPTGQFFADDAPDPRKLTVLVRVKPPAGIDDTFERLARSSSSADERAFFKARAMGGFGSGFLVVRATPGGGREALVITNRHVVELADKADLELADGTALGPAEILYTDTTQDVAILRPTGKVAVERGFAFAAAPPRDQQSVVATGFPGLAGRPSYQTARGYVSNEAFHVEEAGHTVTFVQHTAPIDPGSSGGPLTDERGHVLGVNTLKVTNREAVAFAVPAPSVLEAIRRADAAEARHASATHRSEGARLACLAFVGELASKQPRQGVLESMISNALTSAEGLEAARSYANDEQFARIWQGDSVRAMRLATLVRVERSLTLAGGVSPLETCADADASEGGGAGDIRFRVRLSTAETRDVAVRWEQGRYKIARVEKLEAAAPGAAVAKTAPSPPKEPQRAAKKKK